ILATLSRTAFLAFLLASICMFGSAAAGAFLSMKVSKKTIMTSAALVMLLAGMFVAFFTSDFLYDRILWRFVGGVNVQSDTSFQARLNNWRESYEVIQTVPILGAGPLRR